MTPTYTFWLLAGVLTLAVLALLLLPLLRRSRKALARAEYDLAIYRDQMRELEREIEQGLISGEEAERARNEIARRILAADEARKRAEAALSAGNRRDALAALFVGLVIVPGVALAIYLNKGEPGRPDMPFERRLAEAAEKGDLPALVRRAELKLEKNPDDLRGWMALAPAYEQLGRLDDAIRAYRRAIALKKEPDADLLGSLGEVLVQKARGRITPEAVEVFRKALAARPGDPMSRYYLAMAELQAGRRDKALAELKKLLNDVPKDAPAHAAIAQQIKQIEQMPAMPPVAVAQAGKAGGNAGGNAGGSGGPTPEEVERQRRMLQNASPEERMAFIRNMVENLEAKLEDNPNNLGGWLRLMRSWRMLGEKDKAKAAYERASKVFASDAQARQRLQAAARQLGLDVAAAPAMAQASQQGGPSMEAVRQRMQAMRNASPEERMAMIRNMVESLDAKLEDNPNNLGGWLRLMRARAVLGEKDKAKAAYERAMQVFDGDEQAKQRLKAMAAQLGIAQ